MTNKIEECNSGKQVAGGRNFIWILNLKSSFSILLIKNVIFMSSSLKIKRV